MRIHFKISKNNKIIPFNYLPKMVGVIHNWIGKNELHGNLSLYSFSFLQKGVQIKNGLDFPYGTQWFISSHDNQFLKLIFEGIQSNPDLFNGMKVTEIIFQKDPIYENEKKFSLASPVLIKRKINNRVKHFTFKDQESSELLMDTQQNKMKIAGIEDPSMEIFFDKSYHTPKTKIIHYKEIGNRTSVCPVIIKGKPETISFIWNVGIGNSTGIGFGSLKE